jgi:RNA-binding protein
MNVSTENLLMGLLYDVFCRKLYMVNHGEDDVFREGNVLQRLGKVLSVTPSQSIVVKLDKVPKVGSAVVDENLKVVGKIFDIIGPVSSPYAVIRSSVKDPEKIANRQLYVSSSRKERS